MTFRSAAPETLICLDDYSGGCSGPTEYRSPLSATGTPYPRCEAHWSERLDLDERLRQEYPDSSTPPSWFDPSAAGERWDDDY